MGAAKQLLQRRPRDPLGAWNLPGHGGDLAAGSVTLAEALLGEIDFQRGRRVVGADMAGARGCSKQRGSR